MANNLSRSRTCCIRISLAACTTLALLLLAGPAHAVNWWLPANYSEHGGAIDSLFTFIFWLTTITMIGVFAVMAWFLVKYRYNPNKRKAHFTHGNPRLEMTWTIIPAIILAGISLATKGVWDKYRFGVDKDPRKKTTILVIGQQFQWNVVYAGPDGKLGKYLVYPKPTDKLWPKGPDGQPITFSYGKYQDTRGPADMPFDDAVGAINTYIDQENPLGKVFDPKEDPDGKDDNWDKAPGRPIYIPKGRPVEVQLSSKDVIHDFFLPNFRVKLDAVPGLRGSLHFVPTITSKELEAQTRKTIKIDDLEAALKRPENRGLLIHIDDKSAKAQREPRGRRQWLYKDDDGTIIRNEAEIPLAAEPGEKTVVQRLKALGVTEVSTYKSGAFDLVCEELCGQGHYKMQGQVIVLSAEEYAEQFETPAEANSGQGGDGTAVSSR